MHGQTHDIPIIHSLYIIYGTWRQWILKFLVIWGYGLDSNSGITNLNTEKGNSWLSGSWIYAVTTV
jgi:hypothetical protein